MSYRAWSVSSKIERFQCQKCGFTCNVQIVGEGEIEGIGPSFVDNDDAQQRALDSAQRIAQKDLARMQGLIACYRCGYRDPAAFRLERAKSAVILLGFPAVSGAAALVHKSWFFVVLGGAVTWFCWAWWRRLRSRPEDHVIFLDDKNCALPRRSLR
jgi:hypothetical protein